MTDIQKGGFAVYPKLDCPHLLDEAVHKILQFLIQKNAKHFSEFQCAQCQDTTQNWICMSCHSIECSRYVKGHMASHNQATKHQIALSFSDASFWCYECQSYIDSPSLKKARVTLSNSKFSQSKKEQEKEQEKKKEQEKISKEDQELQKQLEKLALQQTQEKIKPFTEEELIEGLKAKKYKNVLFLTGAGLSVASGIPDFRSPKTGLYSKLAKYNLPCPEAVFQIKYFKKNPEPFMNVAKQFLNGKFEPTLGHKFIKKIQDQDILLMNMTQNIDDLQIEAGVKEEKLLQAHGHSRSAHCVQCGNQASIQDWKQALIKLQPLNCKVGECKGLIKPDIVFFGQQLPKKFFEAPQIVAKSDLVFIIGTSLAVMPFAFLATLINKNVPVVLINNQDSLPQRSDKLWLKDDIQQNVQRIMKKVGWL